MLNYLIIIVVIIIIMIIIIALKGAIRGVFFCLFVFFFLQNLLTAPGTDSNTYAQVARAQSCANHVHHIERVSRANMSCYGGATWYEGTARLLSLTELKLHIFEHYFIG